MFHSNTAFDNAHVGGLWRGAPWFNRGHGEPAMDLGLEKHLTTNRSS